MTELRQHVIKKLETLPEEKLELVLKLLENIEDYKSAGERKPDKRELKKMFDFAVRQTARNIKFKFQDQGKNIYAMCFRMHYNVTAEWLFSCEVIVQTVKNCEESIIKYKKENEGTYCASDLLAFKYIPEEYGYSEPGMEGFARVQKYLYENCLNDEDEEIIKEFKDTDELRERITKQNHEIDKTLAQTIADIRKEGDFFENEDGSQMYVFPYIGEDDLLEHLIPLAKKMNKGLDLKEYLKFVKAIQE